MASDILHDHDGIVDDKPNGDGQTAQRHQVERLAAPIEKEKVIAKVVGIATPR